MWAYLFLIIIIIACALSNALSKKEAFSIKLDQEGFSFSDIKIGDTLTSIQDNLNKRIDGILPFKERRRQHFRNLRTGK